MSDNFNAEEYADVEYSDDEHAYDLFWHALNYRAAPLEQAPRMYDELEQCVRRLILREILK